MVIYRVGDLLPALSILVKDGNAITNLTTLDVYVRWQKPDGTEIPERQAVVATDPTTGIANYVWEVGDLSVPGLYSAIIQLSPEGNPNQRYSLTNPPLTQIEVLSDTFEGIDSTLPQLPYPSGEEVANVLHMDVSELDGNLLVQSIERGRSLCYTYSELWNCPALVLDPTATRIARELIAVLSAQAYATNPQVVFGPFKKETFGSYSYEMKEGNVVTTKQQTGGKTGNAAADSMISYLQWLCKGCTPWIGAEIMFPDWTQPVTTTIPDPTTPVA